MAVSRTPALVGEPALIRADDHGEPPQARAQNIRNIGADIPQDLRDAILLRVGYAAVITGMSRAMMYKLVASGEVPSVRIHGMVRIPATALYEWASKLQADQCGAGR